MNDGKVVLAIATTKKESVDMCWSSTKTPQYDDNYMRW